MKRLSDRVREIDLGTVVAMSWLWIAIFMTLWLGPQLGARGWQLLLVHHLICVVGTSHELWRAWHRRQAHLQLAQTVAESKGSSAKVHGA